MNEFYNNLKQLNLLTDKIWNSPGDRIKDMFLELKQMETTQETIVFLTYSTETERRIKSLFESNDIGYIGYNKEFWGTGTIYCHIYNTETFIRGGMIKNIEKTADGRKLKFILLDKCVDCESFDVIKEIDDNLSCIAYFCHYLI